MRFTKKVVIVTGAAQGIGKGIALSYAAEGAIVILADLVEEAGFLLQNSIQQSGVQAEFIKTDVRNPQEITKLIESVYKKYKRIDILINNAGISKWKSPYEISVEEWDDVINTNLRSQFLCSREAAKIMRLQKSGSIVNIASTRAFMSEVNSEAYAASKGGIIALTHALAASFATDGIQVNSISPGWIQTQQYEQLSTADHLQHFSQRVGKVEDIARACLYLTEEGNNFITASNMVIDGGITHKMIYEEE
jgi:NAD(P)-dependent dehydrogenase (short-subunit alcohol dehydrogenase family)